MRQVSLGEELRSRRELLNLTLDKLAQKTGIPSKYLRRIEEDGWEKLPSPVYIRGFLRKYAAAVGTNPDEVVRKYDSGESRPGIVVPPKKRFAFTVSSRTVRIGVAAIVFLLILGYIGYQLSAVFIPPELAVTNPVRDEITVADEQIQLKGTVEPGSTLLLNGEPIATNPGGGFEERIELLPGLNTLEIKAVSKFERETVVIRRVIYNPNE